MVKAKDTKITSVKGFVKCGQEFETRTYPNGREVTYIVKYEGGLATLDYRELLKDFLKTTNLLEELK